MIKLARYEFIKICCKRSLLLAILIFSVVNLVKILDVYQSYSYLTNGSEEKSWDKVYWDFYPQFAGKITSEKIDNLLSLYRPLEEKTGDLTASTATDDPDTFTGNIYSDRNLLNKYYVKPMNYFFEYQRKALEVATRARENSTFYNAQGNDYEARKNAVIYNLFSSRDISTFEYTEMYNYYLNYDFSSALVLLLCLYGIVTVFVNEKETQMNLLLITNPNGGVKTCAAKVIAASAFIVGISFWFSVLDFFGFAAAFHTFEGGNLPIYAISNFEIASINVSLFQYAIVSAIIRAIGFWTLGMVMLWIAMFWRTALIPFVINFSVALGLILLGASSAFYSTTWEKIWNPYVLLVNRTLFGKTEFINLFGYPILSYQVAICISVIFGIIAVTMILATYSRNQYCRLGGIRCKVLSTNLKRC